MIELFYKIKEFWNEYDFEIVMCTLLVFFLLLALYRKLTGQTGSWSNGYFYDRHIFRNKNNNDYDKPHFKRDSKGEVECRRVLEEIFRRPFNKARPDFLNNPVTGGNYNLELDCYNEDLRIAVEYNGVQHSKFVPFFHKNHEAFYNQKYRDELKRRMCKDNGITLIEVPYTVKIEEIEYFIINELRKNRFIK
jgi:hypothetical protein